MLNGGEHTEGFVGVILPDVGTSVLDRASSRWEHADRGFLQAAFDAAGVKVDIQNANGDRATFATIANQMMEAGAKVLIMASLDSESTKAVQEKAAAIGVKTIDYDRLTLNGSASYFVSFDDEIVGKLQGEGIKACLDAAGKLKARIAYLNGAPTDNNATLLKAGGKLDAVVSANEGLAIVAIEILKKHKLNGTTYESGTDQNYRFCK